VCFVTRTTKAAAGALALALGLALTGCGGDDNSGDTNTPVKIAVTINGDSVTPNGERVEVATGQTVELDVTADAPGEIHVHSTPEQEFEYDAGSTTLTLDPIDTPGVVDVESHTLDKVIVQLEVR
jgi:hypothetical protein